MIVNRNGEFYGGSANMKLAMDMVRRAVLRDKMRDEYAIYDVISDGTGEILYCYDPVDHFTRRIKLRHVIVACMVSCVLLYAFELFMRYMA